MKSGRKHILILSSWYPTPEHPFLGNFVKRQAEVLSSQYNVTVLHTVPEEGRKELQIVETEKSGFKEILIYHTKGSHFLSRRKNRLKALEEGFKHVEQPNIIHGHVLIPGGYLFVKAKERFKCPLVVTEHASYYRPGRKEQLSFKEKYVLQLVRRAADRIIAVSEFLKRDMKSLFGEKEIRVIANPVNTELFRPEAKKRDELTHFLHVSTLDPAMKNVQGILTAISLLVQKGYEDVRLRIISDEPYSHWKQKVNEMGLNRFVEFNGPCEPSELVPYFQQSDAFVLFSHYETFSIVIAEAWACGIPVISTPVGIAYDMKPDLGINVKDNDPLGLAMAMEKIIHDQVFDSSIIRKHALQYADLNVLEQLNNTYSELHG